MEDEQKKHNETDNNSENKEKKIDYGYLFGAIVLGIFLIYWVFLNLNFKKFSLKIKRIINKIKYIIGSKKIVLDNQIK